MLHYRMVSWSLLLKQSQQSYACVGCDSISCELGLCLGTHGISPTSLGFAAGRSKLPVDGLGASLALLQPGGVL